MSKSLKRICSAMLLCMLAFCAFAEVITVLASETPTTVSITFTGDEADKAGFAQSVITVVPGDDSIVDGYYLVYYTDGKEVLKDYDEILSIKADDGYTVKGAIKDGIMIPVEAKGIAVFESKTRFLDDAPPISSAVAVTEIPESKRISGMGTAELSFGALADSHMNYEPYDRGAFSKLAHSMNFFSAEGMDMVIIAGDATGDRGENPDLEAQYQKHIDIINESDFDFDKVYEAIGNHGNTPADAKLLNQYLGGDDEVHPYKDSPYFYLLRKGANGARDNLFIFMAQELKAPGDSAAYDNFSKAQIDWLEGLLTQYDNENTNIFIIEHSPFLNYGAGDREAGGYGGCVTFKADFSQNMRLKGLLELHKDAVVMSGHTHVSLYDNVNYSDVYNSFARTVHIGSNCQPCGYGEGYTYTRSYDGRYNVTPEYGSEGYTVQVYKDYIVYTGYNFSTGKKIPSACLLIPVKAYGGEGKPEVKIYTPDEAFDGSGTAENPYIIADADDFKKLTDGFNASDSSVESKMYGYGKYFLQTKDIDMTLVYGYSGTVANGNSKSYFAGIYNGGGHTITVNINDNVQRSVFPYVYGAICNLKIEGRIVSEASAQPVRTLYGSVVNCIFEVDLKAERANGLLYSNYGLVYNVYTTGTLTGTYPFAIASNSSSTNYTNVYHFRTANGTTANDSRCPRSDDIANISKAFNNRSNSNYQKALDSLKGFDILSVSEENGKLVFGNPADSEELIPGDVDGNGKINTVDYIMLKRAVVGTYKLDEKQFKRADINANGKIEAVEYIMVKRHVIGTYVIPGAEGK